jgi:hypothetical protein
LAAWLSRGRARGRRTGAAVRARGKPSPKLDVCSALHI